MKEIQLTKGYKALVDDEDYEKLSQYSWQYNSGRAQSKGQKNHIKHCYFMHRLILNVTDPLIKVDHINHNQLDNRKENLRVCSQKENTRNTTSHKDGSSKYLGVHKHKLTGRWRSMIKVNGKAKHIGLFDTEIEAAKAYNKAALTAFGNFANLNQVD